MQPRKGTKTKLEIVFNRKVCREVNGDYSVSGIIIKDALVATCSTEDRTITFKEGAQVDQEPVQAQDTQEWCMKVWYEGHSWILIPVSAIEWIRETLTSKFYT